MKFFSSILAATAVSAAAITTSVSRIASRDTVLSGTTNGISTWYPGNLNAGTCLFSLYSLPAGIWGVAYPGPDWNNAQVCGMCLEVTGPNGNTIKAMVVDQCPECNDGHIDLFKDAFGQIGDVVAGTINVSYKEVSCDITAPFYLYTKDGTSQYWFSIQVVGTNVPVTTLEISLDGGNSWLQTARQSYNFFQYTNGFSNAAVEIRVTSITGQSIIVNNVPVQPQVQTFASGNFAA